MLRDSNGDTGIADEVESVRTITQLTLAALAKWVLLLAGVRFQLLVSRKVVQGCIHIPVTRVSDVLNEGRLYLIN